MPPARIVAVAPRSPAARAGLRPGDELVAVGGEDLTDVIRYQLRTDGPVVELDLRRAGHRRRVTVRKGDGEPLGLQLADATFDRVTTCDNRCPFCFIHQLPPGVRRSLTLKDDDFRLSFLYGNFTTLTRFTEADFERVVAERLSPLYVSIHATDPQVRARLLRNRRGATSLSWLGRLLEAGIEVHGQVVVCPGINDGAVLERTCAEIGERYPALASVGVVPCGVSDHNREPEIRPHTRAEAEAVCDTVARWQERFLVALGRRMVFLADEYHCMTGRPFPPLAHYEGCPQHENGIGMAATLAAEVAAAADGTDVVGTGPRSGFFAWVDGAPACGYRAPRRRRVRVGRRRRPGGPAVLLTGEMGARVLEPLLGTLSEVAGAQVRARAVRNRFFGGTIAVTGLLTGADLAPAVAEAGAEARVLLPDVTLSGDRFLDDTTVEDLPRPVEVVPTHGAGLVAALRS
jgi:putative radical SAM enzyme (TIGR03279 family)